MAAVSLVVTVLNEAGSIRELLDSVCAQTRAPDEVVLVDGGSRDGTVALAQGFADRLPLQVLTCTGANISAGRNRGIERATGVLVAVTDAGVRLDPAWLERITEPLEAGRAEVASGFFVSEPRTVFERTLGAATLPSAREVDRDRFLPSSRSAAFRKDSWQTAGGYPEWLDYCEDLVFDLRLRALGYRFEFVPDAIVYFRPRKDLKAFFVQYFRYARGDGKAALFGRRYLARYLAYGGLITVLAVFRPAWPVLVVGGVLYLRRPVARMRWERLKGRERALALVLLPGIRAVGDMAKMAGYPAGVWWRWRRRGTQRHTTQ